MSLSSSATSAVSEVVQKAREVFGRQNTTNLTSNDVQGILESLGQITATQVGLAKQAEEEQKRTSSLFKNKLPFLSEKKDSNRPITYFHIYECADFTVGIFCIPENCEIPIHDHPGMTVCSKVLYGKVRVESYDKAPDLEFQGSGMPNGVFARKTGDVVAGVDSKPFCCFSTEQNIHRFTAVESCAILDVLGPPYDSSEGREISYYQVTRIDQHGVGKTLAKMDVDDDEEEDDIVLLEIVNPPSEFVVEGREYTGEKPVVA